MSLRKIPVDSIKIPDVRVSSILDEKQRSFLESTIRELGVIQDIIVRSLPDGSYGLVAGKSRLQELKNLGATEVQVKIVDANELQALKMNVTENIARGSYDYIDLARSIKRMLELGATLEEVCKTFNRSETWIRRTLVLLDLPEPIQKAISEGKLTPTHVYLAGKMPTSDEAMDALQTFMTHGWNTSIAETFMNNRLAQLEAAKKAAVEKGIEYTPPKAEPEKLIQYRQCLLCGYRVPSDKINVQLVCDDCKELAGYITSQLGPWSKAKDVVFKALQLYFGQLQHEAANLRIPSREASPE